MNFNSQAVWVDKCHPLMLRRVGTRWVAVYKRPELFHNRMARTRFEGLQCLSRCRKLAAAPMLQ